MNEVDDLIVLLAHVGKQLRDINEKTPKSILKFYAYLAKYIKQGKFDQKKFDKLYESCKASILELIEKQKLDFRNKQEESGFIVKMESLEEKIKEYFAYDWPRNSLLSHLRRGILLSEFTERELFNEAIHYGCLRNGVFESGASDYISPEIIKRDLDKLERILPPYLYCNVHIILLGKVEALDNKHDPYLATYAHKLWKKIAFRYHVKNVLEPLVVYRGWLNMVFGSSSGRFNGKEIELFELDEKILLHEMVHYYQYSQKRWDMKNMLEQSEEEIQARLKREIEAYTVSHELVGEQISYELAEKMAWNSISGRAMY